jgi:hypothetical protein
MFDMSSSRQTCMANVNFPGSFRLAAIRSTQADAAVTSAMEPLKTRRQPVSAVCDEEGI